MSGGLEKQMLMGVNAHLFTDYLAVLDRCFRYELVECDDISWLVKRWLWPRISEDINSLKMLATRETL